MNCHINIDEAELVKIKEAEAIVVREYERTDGSRFGEVLLIGDMKNCQELADESKTVIQSKNYKVISDTAVLVKDLQLP